MKPHPPKKAMQFLRWFCREDYIEEIEGDLFEIFEEDFERSPTRANLKFNWSVVRYFRHGFIKSFSNSNNPIGMFKNDLKIAHRNLKKQPFFAFLNTFGLAVGMAGCLLIALFIYDELSFDKMFADADRIYRMNTDHRTAGETNKYATSPAPLANVLREDLPQTEMVTQFREVGSKLIRKYEAKQNVKEEHVVGVDSTFFDMFGLELLVGDIKTALVKPNTLVLTKTAAEKHFGIKNALGQRLLLDNEEVYIVTGIFDDLPKNSFLRNYSVFLSLESFEDAKSVAWNRWNYPTFIKLLPSANPENLHYFLSKVKETYLIPWAMTFVPGLTVESARANDEKTGNYMRFSATPLSDIHLHSINRAGEFSQNSNIQNVYILSFIGFFLILLACVNFMNLSTAHSLKRAKEVGIRKTLGSNRFGLIRQFLTEAGLVTFLSLLLAITMANMALPFFNELAEKAISIPFSNPYFWIMTFSSVIILGLLAGAYPAFFMSRFIPVKVLKSGGHNSVGGSNIRNSLVVFQFAISVFLIVCTLVVFQQLNFIQNKDVGFQKDQVLIIDDADAIGNQLLAFKNEVEQISQVERTSLSSFLPTPSDRHGTTFFPEGGVLQPSKGLIIEHWSVDHDYIPTLDLEIIAGRAFDKKYPTDSSVIILNESTVAMLNVKPEEAVGMRLTQDFRREDKENMEFMTVIGVVKNFHFETLRNGIDALSFSLGSHSKKLIAKLNAGDFQSTISDIEAIWKDVAPGQPFNYYFMDDSFNDTYKSEIRLGSIFVTFTILSIFIACLGLFGLAAFNAEKRIKEIGIRKVLGASVSQITYSLSINFLKLVGIAVLVALPLSWYAMHQWLEDFSYRTDLAWWIFALATFLAVAISVLTVSFQSIKAAIVSPIKSLRNE